MSAEDEAGVREHDEGEVGAEGPEEDYDCDGLEGFGLEHAVGEGWGACCVGSGGGCWGVSCDDGGDVLLGVCEAGGVGDGACAGAAWW